MKIQEFNNARVLINQRNTLLEVLNNPQIVIIDFDLNDKEQPIIEKQIKKFIKQRILDIQKELAKYGVEDDLIIEVENE